MKVKQRLAGIMAGAAACLALAATAKAQVSPDALLQKLVAKGILSQEEAEQIKKEAATNNAGSFNNFIYGVFWYQGVSKISLSISLQKFLLLYYKTCKTIGLHHCLGLYPSQLGLPNREEIV